MIAQYTYDEWGKLLEIHTEEEDDEEQLSIAEINPLRYRGYYYDNETGYYYLQSRYYDPELCRFISADSFDYIDADTPMSVNAYAYCENNPINFSDSTGHDFTWDTLFDILKKCLIIDFVFPEFRYKPKITLPKVSTKKNNVSKWVSDEGKVIGVVITEIFTCLDLQAIGKKLGKDFSFSNFEDYLQKKVDIYRQYFDSLVDTGAKDFVADKSGFIATILGMIPNLSIETSSALNILPYITALINDYSGRYISTKGSLIMALFDITTGGLIDSGALALEAFGMPEIGIIFATIAEDLYNVDKIRSKAEFIAYNWFYLLFVDWSVI